MASVVLPHAIRNGKLSSHIELNNNFNAISAVVNGNLDGSNFNVLSELVADTLKAIILNTNEIVTDGTLTIKLSSADGSHNVSFKSYQGAEILKIASDGKVSFFGKVMQLPVGSLLMYKGTAILDADSRETDLSDLYMFGWYVCNGKSGTPDLRNRFIVGDPITGVYGGSDDAQVPLHTHTIASVTNNSTDHTHSVSASSGVGGYHTHLVSATSLEGASMNLLSWPFGLYASDPTYDQYGGGHTHSFSATTGANSASHTHTVAIADYVPANGGTGRNVPPYYSLIFVKRMS